MTSKNYSVSFDFQEQSFYEVEQDYHFKNIGYPDTSVYVNTILVIRELYFYCALIKARGLPANMVAPLCRTVIINTASAVESIFVMLAYKIQKEMCPRCPRRRFCHYCSTSLFSMKESEISGSIHARDRAFAYLEQTGLLRRDLKRDEFYCHLKDARNNVHLLKGKTENDVINNNRFFTPEYCNQAVSFMQDVVQELDRNYTLFRQRNGCPKIS